MKQLSGRRGLCSVNIIFLLLLSFILLLVGCGSNKTDAPVADVTTTTSTPASFKEACSPEAQKVIDDLSPDKRIDAAKRAYSIFAALDWGNEATLVTGLETLVVLGETYGLDKEHRIQQDIQNVRSGTWNLKDAALLQRARDNVFKSAIYEYFTPLVLAVYAEQNEYDCPLQVDPVKMSDAAEALDYTYKIETNYDDGIEIMYCKPTDIVMDKNGDITKKGSPITLHCDKHENVRYLSATLPLVSENTERNWQDFLEQSVQEQQSATIDYALASTKNIEALQSEAYFRAALNEEEFGQLVAFLNGISEQKLKDAAKYPASETSFSIYFQLMYADKQLLLVFEPTKIWGGMVSPRFQNESGAQYDQDIDKLKSAFTKKSDSNQESTTVDFVKQIDMSTFQPTTIKSTDAETSNAKQTINKNYLQTLDYYCKQRYEVKQVKFMESQKKIFDDTEFDIIQCFEDQGTHIVTLGWFALNQRTELIYQLDSVQSNPIPLMKVLDTIPASEPPISLGKSFALAEEKLNSTEETLMLLDLRYTLDGTDYYLFLTNVGEITHEYAIIVDQTNGTVYFHHPDEPVLYSSYPLGE